MGNSFVVIVLYLLALLSKETQVNQETYICSQFGKVLPTSQDITMMPYFTIRMKIQSNLGETNYINLSEAQFREIEFMLASWDK